MPGKQRKGLVRTRDLDERPAQVEWPDGTLQTVCIECGGYVMPGQLVEDREGDLYHKSCAAKWDHRENYSSRLD